MMSSHKNLLIGLGGHETAKNAGVNHIVKWAWSLSALLSGVAWALFVFIGLKPGLWQLWQ
jgi:hypothetical protein